MMASAKNFSMDVIYLKYFFKKFYVLRICNFTWLQTSPIVKKFPIAIAKSSGPIYRLCKLFKKQFIGPNLHFNSLPSHKEIRVMQKLLLFRLLHGLPKVILCLLSGQVSIKNLILGTRKVGVVNQQKTALSFAIYRTISIKTIP